MAIDAQSFILFGSGWLAGRMASQRDELRAYRAQMNEKVNRRIEQCIREAGPKAIIFEWMEQIDRINDQYFKMIGQIEAVMYEARIIHDHAAQDYMRQRRN